MARVNLRTRIGTANNLGPGGSYDMLMIGYEDGFPEGRIFFEVSDTPRKITGIQKVAQMFLKILFTNRGSNVIYPDQGTLFGQLIVNSNVSLGDTLFTSTLAEQIRSAEEQVQSIMNTYNAEPASMLDKVTLLGIDMNKDAVLMYLQIRTMAGEGAAISVPFPQLDLQFSKGQSPS